MPSPSIATISLGRGHSTLRASAREIKEIAQTPRKKAGLADEPLGVVASSPANGGSITDEVIDKIT